MLWRPSPASSPGQVSQTGGAPIGLPDGGSHRKRRVYRKEIPLYREYQPCAYGGGGSRLYPASKKNASAGPAPCIRLHTSGWQSVRYSDAGEPSGTGGQPALQVLVREGLTDVCVVVTRYFGGVLLGAGGLTRAYARGAKVAVDAAASRSCGSAVYTQCAAPMRSISACYPCWNRRHAQSVRACLPMKSPSRSPCARRIRREYWKSSRKPAPGTASVTYQCEKYVKYKKQTA